MIGFLHCGYFFIIIIVCHASCIWTLKVTVVVASTSHANQVIELQECNFDMWRLIFSNMLYTGHILRNSAGLCRVMPFLSTISWAWFSWEIWRVKLIVFLWYSQDNQTISVTTYAPVSHRRCRERYVCVCIHSHTYTYICMRQPFFGRKEIFEDDVRSVWPSTLQSLENMYQVCSFYKRMFPSC